MKDVSDNSDVGVALSSTCMAEGSPEGGVETPATDPAERREFSCEGARGCFIAILDTMGSSAMAVVLISRAVRLGD